MTSIGSDNVIHNICIGGIAGGISRTITSPLEITKMLTQNYPTRYRNTSIYKMIHDMYKHNGLKSLFKGNLTNCIRIIPQNAIQLATFNYCQNLCISKNPDYINLNTFISGSIAGIISYSAIYPLETARSKISVNDTNTKYRSLYSTLRHTYLKTGYRSLYNGWLISTIGMVPYQGITYMTYRYLNSNYNNKNKLYNLAYGSIASICAVSATYPCDVLKRKYHLSGEMGNKVYTSYADIIKTTYHKYGLSGFYKGIGSCYMKMIPSSALFFFTVEILSNK